MEPDLWGLIVWFQCSPWAMRCAAFRRSCGDASPAPWAEATPDGPVLCWAPALASVGLDRRGRVVLRSSTEFCRFPGALCRPGNFLRHRPGRNHGFGRLGSLCVARISRSAGRRAAAYPPDVSLLPARAGRDSVGPELLGCAREFRVCACHSAKAHGVYQRHKSPQEIGAKGTQLSPPVKQTGVL